MLTDIRLQQFRSYRDSSFEFGEGVNIVVGPNASGKTNLLEAILVLATGQSYRADEQDLFQHKKTWARIDSNISNGNKRTLKILMEPRPGKQFEIDGKIAIRLTLDKTLPVVLFEPNHLELLSGSPDLRRRYLDDLLEKTIPEYGTIRRKYKRTLAQRNSLLKQTNSTRTQMFPWDIRLSQLAGQIVRYRSDLAAEINKELARIYKQLSNSKDLIAVEYGQTWSPESYESHMIKKLESSLALDKARGFTGSGPHREDLKIFINGHLAGETASRGESRTLVLALKMIELQKTEEARGQRPILLLDDVFSELDGARRKALTEHLSKYQTFITTTDADIILHHFTDTCTVIALA